VKTCMAGGPGLAMLAGAGLGGACHRCVRRKPVLFDNPESAPDGHGDGDGKTLRLHFSSENPIRLVHLQHPNPGPSQNRPRPADQYQLLSGTTASGTFIANKSVGTSARWCFNPVVGDIYVEGAHQRDRQERRKLRRPVSAVGPCPNQTPGV